MRSADAKYRFRIAQGFLEESRQDVALTRWRSAVDNAQLATENAAKAVSFGGTCRKNPSTRFVIASSFTNIFSVSPTIC